MDHLSVVETPALARGPVGQPGAGGELASFGVGLPVDGAYVDLSYSILDVAPVGMAVVDGSGGVWWANAALCQLVGRPRAEILALGMPGLVSTEDSDIHTAMVAAASTGAATGSSDERWVRADGSVVWVRATATAAVDPGGNALRLGGDVPAGGVVVQVVDISPQRSAEQAAIEMRRDLERRNAELERSNQELAEFAYVVSHDLSEPLRVIAGHVQLLSERYAGQLDAQADEWIEFAVDGTRRMRALIDSLLAYSRAGRSERRVVAVDTQAVAYAAIAGLQVAIDAASAVIDVGELPQVEADPSELGRVFANLVANAIKFRLPGVVPLVTVRAERSQGEWRFVVADNGIGIPERHRERVFRLFQRLHARDAYEGTGLGLAISRKIVDRGGGRIWVDSAPAGGAAVWFTVPDTQGAP